MAHASATAGVYTRGKKVALSELNKEWKSFGFEAWRAAIASYPARFLLLSEVELDAEETARRTATRARATSREAEGGGGRAAAAAAAAEVDVVFVVVEARAAAAGAAGLQLSAAAATGKGAAFVAGVDVDTVVAAAPIVEASRRARREEEEKEEEEGERLSFTPSPPSPLVEEDRAPVCRCILCAIPPLLPVSSAFCNGSVALRGQSIVSRGV